MKPALLAVLVLLLVSQNEALECYCGGQKECLGSTETCFGSDSVCASVIFYGLPVVSYFKGCSTTSACTIMNRPGLSSARCCRSDLCNR